MLGRLRHPALVGGDDEQHGGHGPDAGEHGRDEPLVAGHVDERDLAARRSVVQAKPRSIVMPRRRSSAQRSGSMPVSARTSVDLPWSTWPAVATTCMSSAAATDAHGGGERRRRRRAARRAGRAGSRPWSTRPSDRGLARAQRRRERLGQATAALGSVDPGAPPPPTGRAGVDGLGVDAVAAQRLGQALGAGRAARPGRRRRATRVGVAGPRRVASMAARVSLSTRSARASGCRRSRSTRSAPRRAAARPAGRRAACRRWP